MSKLIGYVGPRIRFRCTLCGECCKRYWIPVTLDDVARIARYTGLDPEEFTALFHKDMTSGWDYPEIRLRDGRYYLILKKNLDGSCVFNRYVRGNLICEVHEVKPYVCRFYPFVYWIDGDVVKFGVNEKALGYCPGIGRGTYVSFDREYDAVAKIRRAKEEHELVVSKWNKLVERNVMKGALNEFYTYLKTMIKILK